MYCYDDTMTMAEFWGAVGIALGIVVLFLVIMATIIKVIK